MENKTASEVLIEVLKFSHVKTVEELNRIDTISLRKNAILEAMESYAQQQLKAKQEEIDSLRKELAEKETEIDFQLSEVNIREQQIESQQKEIEVATKMAQGYFEQWAELKTINGERLEQINSQQKEIEGLEDDLKKVTADMDSFIDKYVESLKTIESQSARIKVLVEGIKTIRNDPFQNELVIKHCDWLLTPHTEAKEG